jgi:hypothetical protein
VYGSPIKVVDIELSKPLQDFDGLESYSGLRVLVRLHGTPLGFVEVPLLEGHCSASAIWKAVLHQHSSTLITHLIQNALDSPLPPEGIDIERLLSGSFRWIAYRFGWL